MNSWKGREEVERRRISGEVSSGEQRAVFEGRAPAKDVQCSTTGERTDVYDLWLSKGQLSLLRGKDQLLSMILLQPYRTSWSQ